MTGEVWLVKGIDEKLEKLRWKRFATGLHQPLGMKIVKDKLYVLGRDQITCLHDLNGDDEADFYECVTNAMQTSPGGHDFIVGLETDKEGRWYFASGNQGVCRITGRDQLEVLATGFRNPNGLGISPDGRFITTSVQEGDWTPATSICQIELDQNLGAHFGAGGPKNNQPPEPVLMYLPRGEDNSASSQAFISGDKWASLKGDGNLIHLSSGGGSAWLVMRQNVKGRWQAAAVQDQRQLRLRAAVCAIQSERRTSLCEWHAGLGQLTRRRTAASNACASPAATNRCPWALKHATTACSSASTSL
jgi:hypothetical protein